MSSSAVVRVRCCPTCSAVYQAEYPRCLNDGAELVMMSRDPLVGANVGPYVVDALLGQGGMGRVYRVHHARLLQKRYALKVLLGDYAATPSMRMRFAKEAQSASRLSHPNVVAVCDFGVTDAGLAYLAMDLVEGTPLADLITNPPMAPLRVIHLARQLCLGLAHAHDLGLIHRDLKPDNIIVVDEPAGEVPRIADFGLAISNDASDVRLTTGGMVLGTPAYVAPEQCTQEDIDHRADLYALGVTLFELLSGGRLPFDGDAAQIVGLKVTTAAPRLAERVPAGTVPPALAAIVDRLLARRPADRHADARAVIEALDEAVRFPDEVAAAPAAGAVHTDDAEAPARRRADRADVAALERAVTAPIPFALAAPPARRLVTGVRTERVLAARGARRRIALLAGAIVLAGVVVGAAVWLTRSAGPAVADPQAADPQAAGQPAPAATVAAAEPAAPAAAEPAPPPTEPAPPPAEPAAGPGRVKAAPGRPPAPRRSDRTRPKRTAKATTPAPAVAVAVAALPIVAPAPVPPPTPPAPPPPPPSPPRSLEPRLDSVDVRGALPNATVRRALDRVLSGTRACRSDRPGAVEVRFTIGESRRAADVRATGLASSRCLASALSGLRTDSAPDVGDVEVRARFTYAAPP